MEGLSKYSDVVTSLWWCCHCRTLSYLQLERLCILSAERPFSATLAGKSVLPPIVILVHLNLPDYSFLRKMFFLKSVLWHSSWFSGPCLIKDAVIFIEFGCKDTMADVIGERREDVTSCCQCKSNSCSLTSADALGELLWVKIKYCFPISWVFIQFVWNVLAGSR